MVSQAFSLKLLEEGGTLKKKNECERKRLYQSALKFPNANFMEPLQRVG